MTFRPLPIFCTFLTSASLLYAEAEAETAGTIESDNPILAQLQTGGWPMLVLLALSIFGSFMVIERFLNCNKGNVVPAGLAGQADALFKEGKTEELVKLGESDGSTLGKVIAFVAGNPELSEDKINETAGEIVGRDIRRQLQTTYWLAVVATLSPLVGLLGTVLGMIASFSSIAIEGDISDMSKVAGGISQALITTAGGLIIAVPALASFHFFKVRAQKLSVEVEDEASGLINAWTKK